MVGELVEPRHNRDLRLRGELGTSLARGRVGVRGRGRVRGRDMARPAAARAMVAAATARAAMVRIWVRLAGG